MGDMFIIDNLLSLHHSFNLLNQSKLTYIQLQLMR
uniref:Uncharacterized protein n=1 Tax=viral metagenome TaxID=1070528 RepID=A0A6C0BL45_9ZZZZ